MHQTKKGNEWHIGMKVHVGVDGTLGLIHSNDSTAAAGKLLNGEERRVCGDAG